MTDRSHFTTLDMIHHIWATLGLPPAALPSLRLPHADTSPGLPSSFKVGQLAHSSIALSALAAALLHSTTNNADTRKVTVPLEHACIEFKSERFYTLNSHPPPKESSAVGGLHRTRDGYVRVHDGFRHHRVNALGILGLGEHAARGEIEEKMRAWKKMELEREAIERGAVIVALRSTGEWEGTEQGRAVGDFPVEIRRVGDGKKGVKRMSGAAAGSDKCLRGLRVLEMTRVIAAPVAGRTLAAHGADVLWVTSPKLPDLPFCDRDTGRGKRTAQLDLNDAKDRERFEELLVTANVFIQSYRNGSLAAKGFSAEDIAAKSKEEIVVGTLSAYGFEGPWSQYRGFDSIVQTCSGINEDEAEAYGAGEVSKVLPCQALDHASGYFLATGIMAALYKQATEGGSYVVEVSLAATMKYLKSLGRYEGKSGFECRDYEIQEDVPEGYLETKPSKFGELKAVKHAARIEGTEVGWDIMPKPLGSDEAVWL